jgi:hypothetical protein
VPVLTKTKKRCCHRFFVDGKTADPRAAVSLESDDRSHPSDDRNRECASTEKNIDDWECHNDKR